MDKVLTYARANQEQTIRLIRRMVECESPSDDPAALSRMRDVISSEVSPLARVREVRGGHLQCEFYLPGKRKQGQILVLGHFDTVWPVGTLARMPFRREGGRLWGPGVLDMKSGIAFFVCAMRALRKLDMPVARRVLLQLNCDEEEGSPSSRPVTEREARRSVAVLVLEPGTGPDGKLKTARKGGGVYEVSVHGKAAHAGVDFSAGASAVVELARQVDRIASFTRLERGITVNPGVIAGGTRSNVVAAEARVEVDVRFGRSRDAPALDRKFRKLKPFDKRCTMEVSGGLDRPPMERTPAIGRLFRAARKLAGELGVEVEESMTGGGSDGNYTAALGVPTLDGLGAVGEGAHAPNESILVDRIADRTALLAKLVQAL
jgi:glutamate carboxypeptidase